MRTKSMELMLRPRCGEERVVCRFLILPRRLGGEWRWLSTVRVVQVWRPYWSVWSQMAPVRCFGWFDSHFEKR